MKHPAKPTPAQIEETIARLQRGADHHVDMAWPGGAVRIRLRLLTRSERQVQFAEARRRFAALGIDTVDLDTREEFAQEVVNQILALAVLDPAKPIAGTKTMCEPYFADADACRDGMNDAENAALWDVYLGLERDCDPVVGGGITPALIEAIQDAQKKKAPDLLKGIAPYSLRTYVAITAGLLSSSPTGKSGSGDSPETDA